MIFSIRVFILALGFFCFLANADTENESNNEISNRNGLNWKENFKSNQAFNARKKRFSMPKFSPIKYPHRPIKNFKSPKIPLNQEKYHNIKTGGINGKEHYQKVSASETVGGTIREKVIEIAGEKMTETILGSIKSSCTKAKLINTHMFASILFSFIFFY